MAFSRSFNIHVIKRSLTNVDVHRPVRCVLTVMARSHATAAAAASARTRSGGGRADGRHACGHAAVQRRAVRGQGDVGLCVGPTRGTPRGAGARVWAAWAMALAHQIQECSGAGAAMQRSQNQKWPFPAVSRWPCASHGA